MGRSPGTERRSQGGRFYLCAALCAAYAFNRCPFPKISSEQIGALNGTVDARLSRLAKKRAASGCNRARSGWLCARITAGVGVNRCQPVPERASLALISDRLHAMAATVVASTTYAHEALKEQSPGSAMPATTPEFLRSHSLTNECSSVLSLPSPWPLRQFPLLRRTWLHFSQVSLGQ